MLIVALEPQQGFAVWITGLPASGKSAVTNGLKTRLTDNGIDVAVLESDELRKVLTPDPHYSEQERDLFYKQMVFLGTLLTQHGVPVIFDATANRRVWRDQARRSIPNFMEVHIDVPLALCMSRDPKGIYRRAQEGESSSVPGLQEAYEPPDCPDVVISGDGQSPEVAADRIWAKLIEKDFVHKETE